LEDLKYLEEEKFSFEESDSKSEDSSYEAKRNLKVIGHYVHYVDDSDPLSEEEEIYKIVRGKQGYELKLIDGEKEDDSTEVIQSDSKS
jgi:hypothetical protein